MQRSWKEWEQGIVFSLSSACLASSAFVPGRARTASREAPIGAAGRMPLTMTHQIYSKREQRLEECTRTISTGLGLTEEFVAQDVETPEWPGFVAQDVETPEWPGGVLSHLVLGTCQSFVGRCNWPFVPLGGDAEPSEMTRMEAMSSARATIIGARAGVGDAVFVSSEVEEGALVGPMVVVRVTGGRRVRREESTVRVALEAMETASSAMEEGDTESALDGQKALRTASMTASTMDSMAASSGRDVVVDIGSQELGVEAVDRGKYDTMKVEKTQRDALIRENYKII
ncbi:hypothetical protein GUJ93_ZPchr0011g28057 [Zizania palustris]|uniref:Uncharacterized protein n=1 Tax=Zizania palustris TaxID=103762 RepID=A0A8J5WGB1_ZIZPA|nr:hypothetical protein GUJ93_ZPchr0011g28057 [Zizania palustris]